MLMSLPSPGTDWTDFSRVEKVILNAPEATSRAMSLEDLAAYRSPVEVPVTSNYKGYDVYSCGTWCQGAVVPQTLNLLEGIDLKSLGHNSPAYLFSSPKRSSW